jgi:hypothetical protein
MRFVRAYLNGATKSPHPSPLPLGGKQRVRLPESFHFPTNRLAYDFDEGDWFPSNPTIHGKPL